MSSGGPRLVAVDTNTLVYWLDSGEDAALIQRTKWLFELLGEEKAQVVLPSVVVAEFLVKVPEEQRDETLAELSQAFIIHPFDAVATTTAALLWNVGRPQRMSKKPGTREALKADTLLVATAHAAGAKIIYTHDKQLRKLAGQVMKAEDLPEVGGNLFTNAGLLD